MALDGNREAAAQCISAAHVALSHGNIDKAKRLLERSRRMYPLEVVQQELESRISELKQKQDTGVQKNGERMKKASSEVNRRDKGVGSSGDKRDKTGDAGIEKSYTEAQLKLVQQVNRASCLYEVLGLRKGSVDTGDVAASVRRGYKRLALKLHPDKNSAPGADEAFKKVSRAFQVLSDEKSRQRYDQFGMEGIEGFGIGRRNAGMSGMRRRRRHGGMHRMGNGMHEFTFASSSMGGGDEFFMSPEELFEFLFNRGDFMSQGRASSTSASAQLFRDQAGREHQQANGGGLCGLRGLLLLFSAFMYAWLLSGPSDPGYSFQRTSYYNHLRTTKGGVQYYTAVRSGSTYTQREWRRLDGDASRAALAILWEGCERERDQKNYLLGKANSLFTFNREEYRKRYLEFTTPSCDQYSNLRTQVEQSQG